MDDGHARARSRSDIWLPVVLLGLAGLGWWWSVVSAANMRGDTMSMGSMGTMGSMGSMGGRSMMSSLAAFLVAWVAMMAAMMLPALLPVVRRYAPAARNAIAVGIFVTAYLAVWSAVGVPAFVASNRLDPMLHSCLWVGRVAGAVAVVAGLHQLTPLKVACLRHCRWPATSSQEPGAHLDGPAAALRAGGRYGMFCLGSCWLLMVVMIAFGTMQLAWMLAIAVVIWLEKIGYLADPVRRLTAAMLLVIGVALLVHPVLVTHLL